jgi:hypothetical protein
MVRMVPIKLLKLFQYGLYDSQRSKNQKAVICRSWIHRLVINHFILDGKHYYTMIYTPAIVISKRIFFASSLF